MLNKCWIAISCRHYNSGNIKRFIKCLADIIIQGTLNVSLNVFSILNLH